MGDYCPGAVRVDQNNGGGLDTSMPARAVWHITWDALKPDGSQPQYSAVANYLKNQGYCPHLMWNPFTGYIEQYYPASQSARALAAWNGDGAACVQIEVFFTPGCVVDGVKYATVADTPLKGFDTILSWLDSLGIPRVWPMGSPQWSGNSRDADTWNSQGGHYGHCNVPDNTHTDPGPMPSLNRGGITLQAESTTLAATGTTATTQKEDDEMYIIASDSAVGDGKVWIGNGIVRRHIPAPGTLKAMQDMASWGVLNIYKNGEVQNFPVEALGVDVVNATAAATIGAPFTYLDPKTGLPSKTEPTTNIGSQLGAMAFQFVATRNEVAK